MDPIQAQHQPRRRSGTGVGAGPAPTSAPTTLADDGGILCLGLFRTGTYSMAKALNILGYTRVLHGMDMRDSLNDEASIQPWARAAWANMPFLRRVLYPDPSAPPAWLLQPVAADLKPFGRREWDALLGPYHGATDVASLYAPQLIEAYPKAKVVLCYRDPDAWARSLDRTVVTLLTGWGGRLVRRWAEPLAGTSAYTQLWDVLRAWFEVETADEMRAAYVKRYRRHYDTVRAMVPPAQLLECHLGVGGWGPLCEFLDKPVPDVRFPKINEGRSLRLLLRIGMAITVLRALWTVLRYPVVLAVLWSLARAGENRWSHS